MISLLIIFNNKNNENNENNENFKLYSNIKKIEQTDNNLIIEEQNMKNNIVINNDCIKSYDIFINDKKIN